MSTTRKLTAEQKGFLLQELLSFLLSKDGKAKEDDVAEYFLSKSAGLKLNLQENEFKEQIEFLTSLSVKAEWVKRAGFWRVTEHGKKAYERFTNPKILFQEMTVQSAFRNAVSSQKEKRNSKIKSLALLLVMSPCAFLGFFFKSQHLFYLAAFSLLVLLLAFVLYDARTKSIILGRIMWIEFLVLCATILVDLLFVTTSWGIYYYTYFFVTLLIQGSCIAFAFLYPNLFIKVFKSINQNITIFMVVVFLVGLLFGSRPGSHGLLEYIYGKNISNIVLTLVFAVSAGVGLIYILGGMITNLVQAGYFD